jgi:hypothetical protein
MHTAYPHAILFTSTPISMCAVGATLQDIVARAERDALPTGLVADRVAQARFKR